MVRKPIAVLALGLTALVAGCADYGNTGMGVTVVPATSTTARPIAPSMTTTIPAQATMTEDRAVDVTEEDTPPLVVTTVAKSVNPADFLTDHDRAFALYRFVSPTRNLSCGFSLHFDVPGYDGWRDVGCQSSQIPKPADQDPRNFPSGCRMAGVTVAATGAYHSCFETNYFIGPSNTRVLDYGETITVGDLSCTSRRTGMTCSYGQHGFTVSREEVVLF